MVLVKAIGFALLVSVSSTVFSIECLIRPVESSARLVRESGGEVLVPSTSVYPRCEQMRATGSIEVFFVGEDGKQQSVIAKDERLAKLLPKTTPVISGDSRNDSTLFTAIKYALSGHQRIKQGMVRSDDAARAAEVLPVGKVRARKESVQLELGFISISDSNLFVLFEGTREVLRVQKDLRIITLPAGAFVAGKKYTWRLKTSAENAEGGYDVRSQQQLEVDLGSVYTLDSGATFAQTVNQADRLKAVGYPFEGVMSVLDFVRKN
jgi:hypothetical protein